MNSYTCQKNVSSVLLLCLHKAQCHIRQECACWKRHSAWPSHCSSLLSHFELQHKLLSGVIHWLMCVQTDILKLSHIFIFEEKKSLLFVRSVFIFILVVFEWEKANHETLSPAMWMTLDNSWQRLFGYFIQEPVCMTELVRHRDISRF